MENENDYKGSPFLNIGPHIQKEYFEKPLDPNYKGKIPPVRQKQKNPYVLTGREPFKVQDASIWYKNAIFITNEGYKIKVIEYYDKKNVLVEFINSGVQLICTMNNIRAGQVKNPYHPNKYKAYYGAIKPINSSELEKLAYQTWTDILKRTSINFQIQHPNYSGIKLAYEWYNFQYFKDWFLNNLSLLNPNREIYSYEIDKDLFQWETINEYKIYGPNTCCILPKLLNDAIRINDNKDLPMGVKETKCSTYEVSLRIDNRDGNYIGTYKTPQEAFTVYKEAKESYIRELADRFYKDNAITKKAKEMIYRIDLQYDNSKKLYKIF